MSYRNNMSCGVSVAAVAYMHIKAGHMIKREKKCWIKFKPKNTNITIACNFY
jgi:2-methylaconitate cis-trans-isomerase PrpF